jgi:hypothetical protein
MKISLKKLKKIIPLLGITAMVLCVNTGSNFHIGVNHLNRSLENSNTNPNDSQQFVIDYPIPSYADYPALGS